MCVSTLLIYCKPVNKLLHRHETTNTRCSYEPRWFSHVCWIVLLPERPPLQLISLSQDKSLTQKPQYDQEAPTHVGDYPSLSEEVWLLQATKKNKERQTIYKHDTEMATVSADVTLTESFNWASKFLIKLKSVTFVICPTVTRAQWRLKTLREELNRLSAFLFSLTETTVDLSYRNSTSFSFKDLF